MGHRHRRRQRWLRYVDVAHIHTTVLEMEFCAPLFWSCCMYLSLGSAAGTPSPTGIRASGPGGFGGTPSVDLSSKCGEKPVKRKSPVRTSSGSLLLYPLCK